MLLLLAAQTWTTSASFNEKGDGETVALISITASQRLSPLPLIFRQLTRHPEMLFQGWQSLLGKRAYLRIFALRGRLEQANSLFMRFNRVPLAGPVELCAGFRRQPVNH